MWNNLGTRPQDNEIEVTVLGPGYGESVVVHLGGGEWLIADSCIDTLDPDRPVAPLRYLRSIGVDVAESVKYVVVSHWDDDHVKGIADVVEATPNAHFVCSRSFPDSKFVTFVEAMSIGTAATDGANVRNIRRVFQILRATNRKILGVAPARVLHQNPKIQSWSPSDFDSQEFLEHVASLHPRYLEGQRKAILGSANLTSVVLTIDWPNRCTVLLGADMERHSSEERGWGAIASEANRIGWSKADLVKIPHHGSLTAHDDRMWTDLLHDKPISVIAPFGRGPLSSRPPKSGDVNRISSMSGKLFLTTRHRTSASTSRSSEINRSLRESMISITSQRSAMGIVRHRRLDSNPWISEIFGASIRAK